MAITDFGVNDALAVKLWSKTLSVQALQATDIAPLIGDGPNSIIQHKTETSKGPGDQVTYGLRIQLVGPGFTENQVAEGNGEALALYSDALVINELGHVVTVKSQATIAQQRVPFNLRAEARDGLSDWWAKRWSLTFFNQVCGNTLATDPRYTGLQGTFAPTTVGNRILRQSSYTDDASLTTSDTFTIDLIDKAVEQAVSPPLDSNGNNTIPKIRPVKVEGMECYVVYLHPYQVTSLRTNTGSGQWQDITKFAFMGDPSVRKNLFFSGALGYYNMCVLRSAYDVQNGIANAGTALPNTKRAVLLGAQACMMAFGQKNAPSKLRWNEERFDHGRILEVSAWSIFGLKKTRFGTPSGTMDYGSVVISTYGAAHT
jgi:N4-gp56 family major capsid protein